MPIIISGLAGPSAASPEPVVSALVEFGSALHVLRDPGHHGAGSWAADIRAAMSPDLASWTESWWWTTQAIRSTPFVTAVPPAEEFASRLGQLRAMPAHQLASQLLRPIAPTGDRGLALHWSRSRGADVAAVVEALVLRPDEAVGGFLRFLERSWQEWFAPEWARIRPVLTARTRQFADLAAVRGPIAALAGIDPSLTATAPGSGVSIAKVQNTRHDVSGRGLLVSFSTFIRPHLYVGNPPGQPLLLICPADPAAPGPTTTELTRRLEAVAHRGRLEVARAIATEPRTAGEIAALWHIDPTLANRHLRALSRAGLVRTTRRGRFVQYQLDASALEALGTDLLSLLLR
jgi:DNA-binding transcriptional ArsR family regulator